MEASNSILVAFLESNLLLCSFLILVFVLFISDDGIFGGAVKPLITKGA